MRAQILALSVFLACETAVPALPSLAQATGAPAVPDVSRTGPAIPVEVGMRTMHEVRNGIKKVREHCRFMLQRQAESSGPVETDDDVDPESDSKPTPITRSGSMPPWLQIAVEEISPFLTNLKTDLDDFITARKHYDVHSQTEQDLQATRRRALTLVHRAYSQVQEIQKLGTKQPLNIAYPTRQLDDDMKRLDDMCASIYKVLAKEQKNHGS